MAVNYSLPIWQTLGPWLKLEMINVFNETPQIGFNATVTPDPDSRLDALGLPTGFIRGARFGDATQNAHFPLPRTFRVAFGIRFGPADGSTNGAAPAVPFARTGAL